MKTLVQKNDQSRITQDKLSHFNMVGIVADQSKYILAPIFNDSGGKLFGWMNGNSRWNSAKTLDALLAEAFNDRNITNMVVFENPSELTEWLS